MRPGEIHHHRNFYVDRETGEYRGKYLLVLATLPGGDLAARLLTSRPRGRPTVPPCFHGDPYPAFYFGVIGGQLQRESWLDLRPLNDLDGDLAAREVKKGNLTLVTALERTLFLRALDCTASAHDTTRLQERAIRDMLSQIR